MVVTIDLGVAAGRAAFTYFLGHGGLFIVDGLAWSKPRALLRPSFSKASVSSFTVLEARVQRLFADIDAHAGESFDIQPMFQALTLDVTTQFLLGETPKGAEKFEKDLDLGMEHVDFALKLGPLWWLWRPRAYRQAREGVHSFVRGYVQRAIDRKGEVQEGKLQFLDALVMEDTDPELMVAHVLNVLFAGRDTTATLLGWMMWNLVRNREALERLVREVEALEDLTARSLEECAYLKAVINESKRHNSSTPKHFANLYQLSDSTPQSHSPTASLSSQSLSHAGAATAALHSLFHQAPR